MGVGPPSDVDCPEKAGNIAKKHPVVHGHKEEVEEVGCGPDLPGGEDHVADTAVSGGDGFGCIEALQEAEEEDNEPVDAHSANRLVEKDHPASLFQRRRLRENSGQEPL